jgi:hypothetical protein
MAAHTLGDAAIVLRASSGGAFLQQRLVWEEGGDGIGGRAAPRAAARRTPAPMRHHPHHPRSYGLCGRAVADAAAEAAASLARYAAAAGGGAGGLDG